jgi:hypothetical protein
MADCGFNSTEVMVTKRGYPHSFQIAVRMEYILSWDMFIFVGQRLSGLQNVDRLSWPHLNPY